jgi:hypothetical protein
MAEFTDLVSVMNEVHKDKGGTYGENTAVEIIQLAGQVYRDNKQTVLDADRQQLYQIVDEIYVP